MTLIRENGLPVTPAAGWMERPVGANICVGPTHTAKGKGFAHYVIYGPHAERKKVPRYARSQRAKS